jgi:hypothetical protein
MNGFDAAATSARARFSVYSTLFRWLSARRADRVIVVLGFTLLLPSLDTGLAADDYLHAIMLDRPSPIPGFARAPLDIFRFCDPRKFASLFAEGIFSWWDDPNTRLAFMRPLSAMTHVLDHALFRNQGPWLHLHSALWALALYLGVRALYLGLIRDRLVANLALALYVLDDARGWLVSWVAARNAAIATALSVCPPRDAQRTAVEVEPTRAAAVCVCDVGWRGVDRDLRFSARVRIVPDARHAPFQTVGVGALRRRVGHLARRVQSLRLRSLRVELVPVSSG